MKKCRLIAEIGWNFIGNMEIAKEMINAAKESGADYAKFQTWSVKDLKPGAWDKDGRRDLYKKAELSIEMHHELKEYCDKKKIQFLTSVFNKKYFSFLNKMDLPSIKIASMENNNKEILNEAEKNYDEIFMSTGATTENEIKNLSNSINQEKFVIFHCVSSYPTPPESINLPRIKHLRKYFKRVGYSGHLKGISDALASLKYNPECIEKHFTIDNNLPGRDNQFSILPDQMKTLSKYINELDAMNNDLGLDMQQIESEVYKNYRNRWSK